MSAVAQSEVIKNTEYVSTSLSKTAHILAIAFSTVPFILDQPTRIKEVQAQTLTDLTEVRSQDKNFAYAKEITTTELENLILAVMESDWTDPDQFKKFRKSSIVDQLDRC